MCKHNMPHITGQGETGQVSCVSPSRPTHGPFPPIHASGGVPRNFPVLIRTQQTEEATVQLTSGSSLGKNHKVLIRSAALSAPCH